MTRDSTAVILICLGLGLMLLSGVGVVIASAYGARELGEPLIWLLVGSMVLVKLTVHFLPSRGSAKRHG